MTPQSLTCEEVLEHLLAYLDREVDSHTSSEIERHLAGCRGCFSRAEFERRLKARVQETGELDAPDSLRRKLRFLVENF